MTPAETLRCPSCHGLKVLIDRFDHRHFAVCSCCQGKGRITIKVEETMTEETTTEDPQTAEALLEAVDSLLFKAMNVQVPYMPDDREWMAKQAVSRMEDFVSKARRLIECYFDLEFEAQAEASAQLCCDQCDKACAIDNAPPHHWYCPWCGTLLEIEESEEEDNDDNTA